MQVIFYSLTQEKYGLAENCFTIKNQESHILMDDKEKLML